MSETQNRVALNGGDIRDLAQVVNGTGVGDFIVTSPEATVHSVHELLKPYQSKPIRRTGSKEFATAESFIKYVNEFKSKESAIYLSRQFGKNSFTALMRAIFNGNPAGEDMTAAGFEDFQALYPLPVSVELQSWLKLNGEPMGQAQFSEFLEDMMPSIALPGDEDLPPIDRAKFAEPLQLLELSRSLEVATNEQFASSQRLSSGEVDLTFTVEHQASVKGQKITMPEWFMIRLPIFDKGKLYNFAVRLRFRKVGTDLKFFYVLYRANDVFSEAIDEAGSEVAEKTALRLFYSK